MEFFDFGINSYFGLDIAIALVMIFIFDFAFF